MFRLISLTINDWNYLGHIPEGNLVFIPTKEITPTKKPYTSVLIGANGTGKSTLLSYIGRIFEDLKFAKENQGKRNPKSISFPYSITFQINQSKFQITHISNGLDFKEFKQDKRTLKWNYNISLNGEQLNSDWSKVELPEQVIAISYLPMDRFRQKKNLPNDFYQYLGLRHRSNAASPQYFLNNTLPLLFNYISESKSIWFLKEILYFMSVDQDYFGIQLEYRYKKFFFTGNLTPSGFQELFEDTKQFSKREGTSFAADYYKRYIKEDNKLIKRIVTYLNVRSRQDNVILGEKSLLEFNLFENMELIEELSLIQHLQKLDLLSSASLLFKKSAGTLINSENLSSGEFHFLTTMISIQASLKENTLILIDEPDTSLHPNWQIKYINKLKELFQKWNSTHFIIATHSHFIVSDLENESSEVIGLIGQVPNVTAKPMNTNTFGLSAEEILLDIFGVPTTRNLFIYEKVGEILDMIALRDTENQVVPESIFEIEVKKKVEYLQNKGIDKLSNEDPLKEVIDKIIAKYGRSQ